MKKEIAAICVLIFIVALSLLNIRYITRETASLEDEIRTAQNEHSLGLDQDAEITVRRSLAQWLANEKYSHIMLRHDDVDSVTEAYYDLLEDMENGQCVPAQFEKVCSQIEKLAEIQKPKLSSVF